MTSPKHAAHLLRSMASRLSSLLANTNTHTALVRVHVCAHESRILLPAIPASLCFTLPIPTTEPLLASLRASGMRISSTAGTRVFNSPREDRACTVTLELGER